MKLNQREMVQGRTGGKSVGKLQKLSVSDSAREFTFPTYKRKPEVNQWEMVQGRTGGSS